MGIYYIEQVYLMPYVYSFCQIFQALHLFPTLRLLGTLEYGSNQLGSNLSLRQLRSKSVWSVKLFDKDMDDAP